jgi:hypothetical protein
VVDGAGVVRPTERELPRMDPPNVLWFAGAYATSFAAYAVLETLPDSHDSLWPFLASIGFLAAFAAASVVLLRQNWWIPSGLALALAVSIVPAVGVAFLRLIGADSDSLPTGDFSWGAFAVAIATAAAGLVAYARTRFPFLFVLVVGALLVAAQLLVPAFVDAPHGRDHAVAAVAAGGLAVLAGLGLDGARRRRDAFWFHLLGWFSVGAGLAFFTIEPGGDHDVRGWIPMLVAGVLVLAASALVGRASWAVYGVLGYYAPVVHYMSSGLDEDRWTFALVLLAVGLSIFAFGLLLHRFGGVWRRRPPAEAPL